MPSAHDRIAVTRDPVLAAALDRAAALREPGTPAATLVRDLAIRGASAMLADHRDDADAIERLVARSTSEDPGYDREVLEDVGRRAWGK